MYSYIRAGTVYPQFWKQKRMMLVYSCIRADTVYPQYWKQKSIMLVYSCIRAGTVLFQILETDTHDASVFLYYIGTVYP